MILSHYMLWVTTKSTIIKSSGTGPTYQFQTDNNVTKKGNKIKASCIILGFLVFFICVKGQKGNLEKKESVSFSKPPPDVSRAMEPQAMPKKQHIQPHKGQHQAFCTVFKLLFFLKNGLLWMFWSAPCKYIYMILFIKWYSKRFVTPLCRFKLLVWYCFTVVAVTLLSYSGLHQI